MTTGDRFIAELAARLANAALDLDPTAAAALERLEGRSMRVESRVPPFATTIIVKGARFRISRSPTDDLPNVIVRGDPSDLIARFFRTQAAATAGRATPQAGSGSSAAIEIEGDASTLVEFEEVFRSLRPDPAALLGRFTGTDLADTLVGAAELAIAALRSAADAAASTARRSASEHYASREAFTAWLDDLDALRLRVDRVDARIRLLEHARSEHAGEGRARDPGGSEPGR